MTQETELTNREHQELSSLYQVTVSDLAFFKSQQWTLTNYALVAFAAIIGIPFLESVAVELCGRLLLCLVATIVYVFSTVLLWRLKSSIDERRERLDRVFDKISQKIK